VAMPPQLFFSMPRACPVEAHARGSRSGDREAPRDKPVTSRREAAVGSGQREPPRHKAVASGWLTPPQLFFSMPRACPVEAHVGGYCRHSFFSRCHGHVPWRLTLVATAATAFFLDATGLFRGGSRWWLLPPQLFFSMPRACPVEAHAGAYCRRDREAPRDKPVASRREAAVGSGQREPPRHKAVASEVVNAQRVSSLQLEPFRNGEISSSALPRWHSFDILTSVIRLV
jgi:hypothetical protein